VQWPVHPVKSAATIADRRGMRFKAVLGAAMLIAVLLCFPAQAGAARAGVAAAQVALSALDLYGGTVDGVAGPLTRNAVRAFQRRRGLAVDGIVGPQTRAALGSRGAPRIGSRTMRIGQSGWDVAALQFLLVRRGYSPGGIDGGFGSMTDSAVRRFQSAAGLTVDGLVGPNTIRALRGGVSTTRPVATPGPGGPVAFLRPVRGPIGDGFGMRWGRMHTGVDFPAPSGAPVGAAGQGSVKFAGWNTGGYGYLVVVTHRLGFETWYAHLSRIAVAPGQAVTGGSRIGYVGATGHATGPHLHFEVRLNGTPIDPVPRLLSTYAARVRRSNSDLDLPLDLECVKGRTGTGGGASPKSARLAGCRH
jgi:peptidase M23-like protein/putative peptidoglycan binding protein